MRIEACAAVPLAVSTRSEAVAAIIAEAGHEGRAVHFCNAYTLALAHGDDRYRRVLREASACFPDGQAVVWVRRLLARSSQLRKVSGPDFFEAVFAASTQDGPRHFLLGSDPATLTKLDQRLRARFPTAQIVGRESPPFRQLTDAEYAQQDRRIQDSGADIVWVGLGTPKQDFEVQRLARTLSVTAVAVGAAFDFSAGTKKRAPAIMRAVGLEWVHRLASEPRRLWKRYLVGNAVFLWAAWTRRREPVGPS